MSSAANLISGLVFLAAVTSHGHAQAPCRVIDVEISGSYTGGCKDGLADGYGEALGSSAEYKGHFREGKKHGFGVKQWANGDRYEGEFVNDMKHGVGVYSWSARGRNAGEKYTGGYRMDRRDGNGTYEWPSGDRYIGPWKRDVPTGPLTRMMAARVMAERAAAELIAVPGTRVCRSVTFGIAVRDLIKGDVVAVEGPYIHVRIVDPGQQVHVVDNVPYHKNANVQSKPIDWMPCR